MLGVQDEHQQPTPDSSRTVLDCLHRLLVQPASGGSGLAALLAELAGAFGVPAAGLATLPDGATCVRHPGDHAGPHPLNADLVSVARRLGTVIVPSGSGTVLAAVSPASPGAGHSGWLLWLEDARQQWSDADRAVLVLAAEVLARHADAAAGHAAASPRWAEQLERALRQQSLEAAAEVTRRLAHDFGNVLTGILGFSELALGQQVAHHSVLHNYLSEVHSSACSGAVLMQQLRLFSRRKVAGARACVLARVLAAEEARLRSRPAPDVSLRVTLPPDLPPVRLDADELQAALGPVLDNACEAVTTATLRVRTPLGGSPPDAPPDVIITARAIDLSADECGDLYGNLAPGPHVEVVIVDRGEGLSAETQRRLFCEPFFSTRSRRRGFGLATAYGVLHAHRGGIDLRPHPDGGAQVRIVLPVAPAELLSLPAASVPAAVPVAPPASNTERPPRAASPQQPRAPEAPSRKLPSPGGQPDNSMSRQQGRPGFMLGGGVPEALRSRGRERILVVDDDTGILAFVRRALEQAGYRVHTADRGEQALETHGAAGEDPFHLVLSDVRMPGMDGVDLAHRLLNRDGDARVVFMTGNVSLDHLQEEFRGARLDVLPKPFSAEQLLLQVHATLDRFPLDYCPPPSPQQGRAEGGEAAAPPNSR
jgi:signal transduction histidine kinase/CheY-like chemotaxis protein